MLKSDKKDARLDVVRCLMNYMVVLLHASAAFQYVQHSGFEFRAWTFVCSHLCWMSIPTFFLISGYLLFKGFSFAKWPEKISRRVKRLALPYIAWNTLFVVFYLFAARAVPRLATRVDAFGLRTLDGALGKIAGLVTQPIDGPLWFLRTLFFFALASPVVWCLIKAFGAWAVFGLSVLWVAGESLLELTGPLHLTLPAYSIACMTLGGALAVSQKGLADLFKGRWWLLLAVAACVLRAVIFMSADLAWVQTNVLLRMVVALLPIIEAPGLIAMCAILRVDKFEGNPVYRYFQGMGFFAYAGHFLFCSILLHLAAPRLGFLMTGKLTVMVVLFAVGGVLSMAMVYWVLKKLLPRFLRVIDGSL